MTDRERPEDEQAPKRSGEETRSGLDATLEGLPDDPVPPMPHLRPIRDILAARRAELQDAPRAEQPPALLRHDDDDAVDPEASDQTDGLADASAAQAFALAPWRDEQADAPEETPDVEALEPEVVALDAAPPSSPPETADDETDADHTEATEVAPLELDAEEAPVPVPAAALAPVALADVREAAPEAVAPEAVADDEPATLPRRSPAVPLSGHLVVLVALATAVMLAFVLIEPTPRWLLLVGAGVVILGMDGVLRATWREPFASGETTTPYLFLPALYMLGAPTIVEHNIPAPAVIFAGVGLGIGFAAIVIAELISVRPGAPEYPYARLVATTAAYFTLFALASMTYVFDAGLAWSLVVMAILGIMLGVEVLREGEIDPMETLIFALIVGFVLLQARWVLHYLPLESYMAGLTLTLVFFFTTGLLHAHITRQFGPAVVVEYTGIAAAGLALVVAARATGLA